MPSYALPSVQKTLFKGPGHKELAIVLLDGYSNKKVNPSFNKDGYDNTCILAAKMCI